MKKKIFIIILIIIASVVFYLNRSYAHIYNLIGEKNLQRPTNSQRYVIEPESKINVTTTRIVFLGDSLTAGVGALSYKNSLPYLISKKLTDQNYQFEVLNLGTPGATTLDVLNNQVQLANDFHPDQVYIFIGINDMHNRVPLSKFYETLTTIFKNINVRSISIINIPYLGSQRSFLPPYQTYFDWQTKKYNNVIKQVARQFQLQLVDIYTSTVNEFKNNTSLYSSDLFHPNDKGYQLIADEILK